MLVAAAAAAPHPRWVLASHGPGCAPARILSPSRPRPPPEPEAVDAARDEAARVFGARAAYFCALGNRTTGRWAAEGFSDSGLRASPPCAHAAFAVCACGDSIAREVSFRAAAVFNASGTARWLYQHRCFDGWERAWAFLRHHRDRVPPKGPAADGGGEPRAEDTPCDVAFVGVPGLHTLSRGATGKGRIVNPDVSTTVERHRARFRRYLAEHAAVASSLRLPTVLVGTPALDGATVVAEPAKWDYLGFVPFALAGWFARAEVAEVERYARGQGRVQGPACVRPGAACAVGPHISYLDAGSVTRAHRGVRCDGMHFASSFEFALYEDEAAASRARAKRGRKRSADASGPALPEPAPAVRVCPCRPSDGVLDRPALDAVRMAGGMEAPRSG